jgi:hypothetical protein
MSHAGNNGSGRYFVNGFVPNSQAVQENLLQYKTGKNNACGPTSLLFVDNHYVRQATGSIPSHLTSVALARDSVNRIYGHLGQTTNTVTTLDQLKWVAQYKWGYANVRRMSGAAGNRTFNLNQMETYLTNDWPILVVLNRNYSGFPIKSPIDHIAVVFAYNKMQDEFGRPWYDSNNTRNEDLIEYYEPYYGIMGSFRRRDSAVAVNLSEFSYLVVGR